MKRPGIIILIIGLFLILYTGFIYIRSDKVEGLGYFVLTMDKQLSVHWEMPIGIGMIVIGDLVLVLRMNRKDEKEILEK
jgi:hypothetical protein